MKLYFLTFPSETRPYISDDSDSNSGGQTNSGNTDSGTGTGTTLKIT